MREIIVRTPFSFFRGRRRRPLSLISTFHHSNQTLFPLCPEKEPISSPTEGRKPLFFPFSAFVGTIFFSSPPRSFLPRRKFLSLYTLLPRSGSVPSLLKVELSSFSPTGRVDFLLLLHPHSRDYTHFFFPVLHEAFRVFSPVIAQHLPVQAGSFTR